MSKKIDKLKIKFNKNTSEELFDIIEQPEAQCPNIDKIIDKLLIIKRETETKIKDIRGSDDLEEVISLVEDIDWTINDISENVDLLENLRKKIELIREWGESWKSFAKYVMEKDLTEEEIINNSVI